MQCAFCILKYTKYVFYIKFDLPFSTVILDTNIHFYIPYLYLYWKLWFTKKSYWLIDCKTYIYNIYISENMCPLYPLHILGNLIIVYFSCDFFFQILKKLLKFVFDCWFNTRLFVRYFFILKFCIAVCSFLCSLL